MSTVNPAAPDTCRVKILDDVPTTVDSLGLLGRVVEAIAAVIENPTQTGRKAMLLEGTWGSGKSSVIKMLGERLKAHGDIAVVIFDAWGHQGDPLRRSFIESLAVSLSRTGWLKPAECDAVKDWLRRRRKDTETSTTTHLSTSGTLVAAAALLVPIGLVFLSAVYTNSDTSWITRGAGAALGYMLAILPLVIAFGAYIARLARWRRERPGPGGAKQRRPNFTDLLVRDADVHAKSTSLKGLEPTSVEFCEEFDRVVGLTLDGHKARRLLLVVDNLDRVAEEDARTLWSTMRGIFEEGDRPEHDWLDRVWLVVPMDPEAADRLWERTPCPAAKAKNGDRSRWGDGAHFLAKTFQTKFRVPFPVISGCDDLLRDKLAEAIPCCGGNLTDVAVVQRLFERLAPGAPFQVTPRMVVQFVNRLAGIHSVWKKDVPLTTQAAYALSAQDININPRLLASGDVLDATSRALLGQDMVESDFARMHYGVPERGVAAQIVLYDSVRAALQANRQEDLDAMRGHPWFSTVVEIVISRSEKDWAANDGSKVTNAALALAHADPEGSSKFERAWNALAADAPKKWLTFGDAEGRGLSLILARNPRTRESLASDALVSICDLSRLNAIERLPGGAQNWLAGAMHVVRYLWEKNLEPYLNAHFRVPQDTDFYLRVMSALADHEDGRRFAGLFRPRSDPAQLVATFAQSANDKNKDIEEWQVSALKMMTLTDVEWPWDATIDAVATRVRTDTNSLRPPQAAASITILSRLWHRGGRYQQKAHDVLEKLTTQGHTAHLLMLCKNEDLEEATALCAFAIFYFAPSHENMGTQGQSVAGLNEYDALMREPTDRGEIAQHFTSQVSSYMSLPAFHEHAQKAHAERLARHVLRLIAQDAEAAARYFDADGVLASLDALHAVFGSESAEFLASLPSIAAVTRSFMAPGFSPTRSGRYLLLSDASTGKASEKDLTAFLRRGIEGLGKDDWLRELAGPTVMSQLVATLTARGSKLSSSAHLAEALLDRAAQTAKGVGAAGRPDGAWMKLVAALSEAESVRVFQRSVGFALGPDSTPAGREALLRTIEPWLRSGATTRSEADEIVNHYCANAETAAIGELTWLAEAFRADMSATRASVESLRTRIQETRVSRKPRLVTRGALDVLGKEIDAWLLRQVRPEGK